MSKAYQFPHDEPNPFAETNAPQPAPGDNPYAGGALPVTAATQTPDAFEQTLPSRSGLLIGLSVTSLITSLIALAMAFFCLPLGAFVVMLSAPTVAMAQHDLRAMKVGAMSSVDQASVKVSFVIAIIASVVGMVALLIPVGLLIWAVAGWSQ